MAEQPQLLPLLYGGFYEIKMRKLLIIIGFFFALPVLASSVVCRSSNIECSNWLKDNPTDGGFCYVNSKNPIQCEADLNAKYQQQEKAKYQSRTGQIAPVDYFIATTSLGGKQPIPRPPDKRLKAGILWAILGILLTVVGYIGRIIWKENKKK